ncbi:MAG: GDP-L-fucose synthase [Actinobacteria bacterium]|nr:GDP-L-fucose synthase [Actinomycetota bacterium]
MTLRGQRVLVTGGTGFLGRRAAAELSDQGAEVVAVGSADYDLRDRDQIRQMLAEHRPDMVVHLAAVLGGIAANRAEPGRFFYENAIMGIELIEACRAASVSKTVIAGTVSSYPKDAPVPFTEEDFWKGYPHESEAAFALAKKMLLAQVIAYRAQYGMNLVYLIPVNLYGPGDKLDPETTHVVPAMVRRFLEARESGASELTLWGDGAPTREFLFVDDAARAFALALDRYDRSEPLNIGSGEEISIRDLARMVKDATGFAGDIRWDTKRPNGPPRRRLYSSNAYRLLGFEPKVTLDEGIRQTVEWAEQELFGSRATTGRERHG